jgi:hypothetical protein
MVLPSYILNGDDLEKAFERMPVEKFRDLIEGRMYVSGKLRPAVNAVLQGKYYAQLPAQMKVDAYAVLSVPALENNNTPLSQFTDELFIAETIKISEA